MSSDIYERRLKKEFDLLQKLQNHPSVNNETIRITIEYQERGGGPYKSVKDNPRLPLYPNSFRVTYKMPMLVMPRGRLKRDWQATFVFSTPEHILMNPLSSNELHLEDNVFPAGSIPFHNHVSKNGTWFCQGGAWSAAQQGYGIWYFILACGCILNLERGFVVDDPVDAGHHLNEQAFIYWRDHMDYRPISNISWPLNLDVLPSFGPSGKTGSTGQPPKFTFGTSKNEEPKKTSFSFGPKKK